MRFSKLICLLMACVVLLGVPSGVCAAQEPIILNCWVYYNGMQEKEFEQLLEEFNNTVGMEQGIFVEARSQGGVNELAQRVSDAAQNEVGAEAMPDLFAAYADTAYLLHKLGVLADLTNYITPEELSAYVDAYVKEGRLGSADALYIFPVAKSTELFMLDRTHWNDFAAATGVSREGFATWEGIAEISKQYFEWWDAQTPDVDGDGKAFFGRDALANYLLIGAKQLGVELFSVKDGKATLTLDRSVLRKLWDCFYVPYVSGWYGAYGRFRSDDVKTGLLLALVGSSSGAPYFPSEVTYDDGTTSAIECEVLPLPNFEGKSPVAVQQGAGFAVSSSTPEREQAAVTFLKWFTEPERNLQFSMSSGYLPVTKAAIASESIKAYENQEGANALKGIAIAVAASITETYELYANEPFENGVEARTTLENSFRDVINNALAERLALQKAGQNYAQAVQSLVTDERFEQWADQLEAALLQVLGK
ncbi:MAG: extracellular solute-binding protein [Clostridia bacterium]